METNGKAGYLERYEYRGIKEREREREEYNVVSTRCSVNLITVGPLRAVSHRFV